LRSFESDLSVSGEHPLLLPTFETNTSSGLNVSFRHLKEAAKPRVVFCPIGKGGDWSDLPQCQPATLTTVFEHGLPQAHSMLKDLYKHGPMEIRDFRLAEYHEAVSGLQGRFGNFLKLYTCEILNKIKMDASMVDLFFKRLESDAFYPHGITNQSDVPLIRENILMELNSCL